MILTFSGDVFYQNKEMLPLYNPFLINMNEDDIVKYVQFKENDVLWSKNFKRGLISALQVQGNPGSGAFVINEVCVDIDNTKRNSQLNIDFDVF